MITANCCLIFKKLTSIAQDIAAAKKEKNSNNYDALMSVYNPVYKSARMDAIFAQLGPFIREFIKEVVDFQKKRKIYKMSKNTYPLDKQKDAMLNCIKIAGFDFNIGRVDKSVHPFSTNIANEVRVTTRYNENNFLDSLKCIMHEAGHAVYEMNLAEEYYDRPYLHNIISHEIVASLFGTQICHSRDFIGFVAQIFKKNL